MSPLEDDSTVNIYPESPTHIRRWATYKENPAEFALTLAEHSGFDAIALHMTPPPSYGTPPPSYSRIVQPKLKLSIPNAGIDHIHNASHPTVGISDSSAIESADNSPTDASYIRSNETSLTSKIRTRLRKRSTGFRDRLLRTSGGSRSSSTSTSPSDMAPFHHNDFGVEMSAAAHSQELCIIQELDGQPIPQNRSNSTGAHVMYRSGNSEHATPKYHAVGTSSIVPTPRRGLSVASLVSSSNSASSVNAGELSGRLQFLRNQGSHDNTEVTISPCTPVSFQGQFTLARSNAITNSIQRIQDPVSPLSAAPHGPPTTPTLDGRLDSLPRITTPVWTSRCSDTEASRRLGSVVEIGSGKELVPPSRTLSGRLDMPFSSPHWEASKVVPVRPVCQMPQSDAAANAPEVLHEDNMITAPVPRYNRPAHTWSSTGRPYERPSPVASLVGTLCEVALGAVTSSTNFLKARYGPEPPVPEKHVRVRWRCTCGEHVYDDFIENRLGAAAELEAYLNRVPQAWTYSPASSHPSSAASPVFSPTGGPSPLSSISAWSSPGSANPYGQRRWDVSKQSTRVVANNAYKTNLTSYINTLWLYTCVNEGRWCTKMRHLDVNASKVSSDKDLALALSALYTQVNRRWSKVLKLRGLVTIRFVQFELHRNRFADVSRSPALPDPHSAEGFSYDFEPHDLNPPVGSNYLMHLFKHPEDYDDELIAYLRTPKRKDRLELGTGWGLELVEGFLAERVWGAFLGLCVLGSLIFAIIWACKKGNDLQGAFSVAGYIIGAACLILAWAQTVLD